VTGASSGKKTGFGTVGELQHYRVALICRRKRVQGIVQEAAGAGAKKRGRYLIYVGHSATLAQENMQTSFGKGQLAQMPVTFKLNPITGQPAGEEHGYFFDEDAGTIG